MGQEKVSRCLNCSKAVTAKFCSNCGQKNADRDISVWTLINEFLSEYFSFDSKFFQTLIPLFTQPGKVPLDFMEGKRVRYIPPLRSLIFSSFIFFLLIGLFFVNDAMEGSNLSDFNEGLRAGLEESHTSDTLNIGDGLINVNLEGLDSTAQSGPLGKMKELKDAISSGVSPQAAVDSIAMSENDVKKRFYLQWAKLNAATPKAFMKYMIGNFSILLLVIQPFFAFLLWLLYVRRRKTIRYIRHVVHSLYTHTWIMLVGSLLIGLHATGMSFISPEILVLLVMPYFVLSMRKFYVQSWSKTIFKGFLVFLLYGIVVFPVFLMVSVALSFLFF